MSFPRFKTIIHPVYDEADEVAPTFEGKPLCWMRIRAYNYGVTVEVFKERPTEETPQTEAMGSVDADAYNNALAFLVRNSLAQAREDRGPTRSFRVVSDIAGWMPPKGADDE
jgi:hypothetical protein